MKNAFTAFGRVFRHSNKLYLFMKFGDQWVATSLREKNSWVGPKLLQLHGVRQRSRNRINAGGKQYFCDAIPQRLVSFAQLREIIHWKRHQVGRITYRFDRRI